MYEIRITRDEVSPALRDLYDAADAADIVRLACKAIEVELRTHFADRAREPNERGWRSSGFWNSIGEATAMGSVQGAAGFAWCRVSIAHPAIFSKLYGATITPKRGKFLATPATAAAAAAGSPREGGMGSLEARYVPVPSGGRFPGDPSPPGAFRLALVVPETKVVERTRKLRRNSRTAFGFATQLKEVANRNAGVVHYWLLRSATVRPDARAFPPESRLSDSAIAAVESHLKSISGKAA
jgi:hypothetical protein